MIVHFFVTVLAISVIEKFFNIDKIDFAGSEFVSWFVRQRISLRDICILSPYGICTKTTRTS